MNELVAEDVWLKALLQGAPFLDVRSPNEFQAGALPDAINIPLLNNEEFHLVGLTYKEKGPAEALAQGHRLVQGESKNSRVQKWQKLLITQPHLLLYCFRGGQRSSIVQSWLREQGLEVPRIQGGYKFVRRRLAELLDEAVQESCFVSVSGMTGAGKTRLLRQTLSLVSKARILDLEHLANHKGSAFGKELSPQPSQPSFEMALAVQLVKLKGSDPIYVEDEARTLGKITLPSSLFQKMRACPLLLIEESLSFRVQTIIEDYLVSGFQNRRLHGFAPQEAHDNLFQNMSNNILRISKKLGSLRTKEALTLLQESFRSTQIKWTDDLNWTPHAPWIQFLLENYYDPYYQEHLLRQSHRPLVKVSWEEALKKLSLSSTSGE